MRYLALGLLLLGGSCNRPAARSEASPPMADLVVYGKVWTGDSARPWAQAVAARGDTIVVVGERAGCRSRYRGRLSYRLSAASKGFPKAGLSSEQHRLPARRFLRSLSLGGVGLFLHVSHL